MSPSLPFETIAQQLLRALRGKRSQASFSRRLGFRSNVAAKWESGQRMPTAAEVIRYSALCGVDLGQVFRSFHPNVAASLSSTSDSEPGIGGTELAQWLSALRGAQRLADIAQECGLSRYSVGRFLGGQAQPRLPQFLALVEALTHRLEDLVDGWVGVQRVPCLEARFRQVQATREAMMQRPVCLAIMCLLDTQPLRSGSSTSQILQLAGLLEREPTEIEECLLLLAKGGVIELGEGSYVPRASLTVNASSTPQEELFAKGYWARLAAGRLESSNPMDVCSYNVFSISTRDFSKLKQLQREFYRSAQALIAASEPTDLAALLMVQLVTWPPADSEDGAQAGASIT